jgi:hypothetical protein
VPPGQRLRNLAPQLPILFGYEHLSSSTDMELNKNPLGTFSTLARELRDDIWYYALTDSTIVYHAITEAVPLPLLGCSKVIREEVLPIILRERSVTFQTHAALSSLLADYKSEKSDATIHETSTALVQARLPKKIRLSLFCSDYQAYRMAKTSLERSFIDEIGRIPEEHYESELDGWREALQQYPITHLTTVTLDCTLSPRYYGGPGDAPPGMTRFTKRVATRIRMGSKGRCQCLLVAPSATLRQLMWHAGTGSLLREWTPADDGWSTQKIEAFDSSFSAAPVDDDHTLRQASEGLLTFSNIRQPADNPSPSANLTTYHYEQGQPRMRKRRRTHRDS